MLGSVEVYTSRLRLGIGRIFIIKRRLDVVIQNIYHTNKSRMPFSGPGEEEQQIFAFRLLAIYLLTRITITDLSDT